MEKYSYFLLLYKAYVYACVHAYVFVYIPFHKRTIVSILPVSS